MTQLRFETSELKKALGVLGTKVPKKPNMPILSDILIRYNKDKKTFTLTASDLEAYITIEAVCAPDENGERRPWFFCDSPREPMDAVCINYQLLKDAISTLPTMPATATLDLKKMTIKVDYQIGEFTIPVEDPSPYPSALEVVRKDAPHVEGGATPVCRFTIDTNPLLRIISDARVCVGNELLRPVLSAVVLDCFHDRMVVVSSDGHSLYRQQIDTGAGWLEYGEFAADSSARLLLPSEILSTLTGGFAGTDTITITADSQRISIESGSALLVSRTIEGNYPNYNSVVPTGQPFALTLSKSELLASLRRISIFADYNSEMAVFERKEAQLLLQAEDKDFSFSAEEGIDILESEQAAPKPPIKEGDRFGVKIPTVTKLIKCIKTDNVRLELEDPSRPILIKECDSKSNLTLLCMPMVTG